MARGLLRPPSPPRQFPNTGFQIPNNSLMIEEEREQLYSPTTVYPVRIGQVLHSIYQVVGKLG
jgi:serine/threonine-protein kinase SRPK3